VPAGIPGTSSNLPSDTTPIYQTTGTQTAETSYVRNETTTNYEVTTAQTHTVVTPGQVKNLSVSVLVDNVTDAATLTVLTNIASRAAGIDTTRGDQVAVQSIAFDRSYYDTETAAIEQESQTNLYIQIGVWVAIGLVALLLIWFIIRLMNNLRLSAAQDVWTPLLGAQQPLALGAGANSARTALNASQARATLGAAPSQAAPHSEPAPVPAPVAEAVAAVAYVSKQTQISPEVEQLQRSLSRMIEQRPATAAEIIRLWIEEDGPRK
jgi:flagellar M-ring protein FliF